ncbi:MAG TPA: tripartite tricarboxylate transporter substrate binding protein [Ramlibacter sp.]|nr:tripartite tricarboxylate transporter substrate binding protein [Ramlibacter sp.]
MRMSPVLRRSLLLAALALAAAGPAAAQEYPDRPIRMVTPYAPGGTTDLLARLIGQRLGERLGQSVVIENRGGGNTVIGSSLVAKAPADGYTIMLMAMPHVIVPLLFQTPYHPINDFTPVAAVAANEQVLVAHPSLPVKDVKELVALARGKPGELNFATVDSGGPGHLLMESFNNMIGAKMTQVPFKGAGPAINAIRGNQVQLYLAVPGPIVPTIKSGALKAIAVSGKSRMAALPDVPTFAEQGLANFDAKTWYGILAPAGTPRPIVQKLSGEIQRIMAAPDIQERLENLSVMPFVLGPDQLGELMRSDMARYKSIIETNNIKIQ